MTKTRPIIDPKYLALLFREDVAHIPRRFSAREFQETYYAPGGLGERMGGLNPSRLYRVAEISTYTQDNGGMQLIDHHAGNAWWAVWMFASHGYVPDHMREDSPRALCDLIVGFPGALRDRLDAAFDGLRTGVDSDGFYEGKFMERQRDWHNGMQASFAMSNAEPPRGRYKTRLRLCRQAAKELYPELIEWFEDLRANVCDGGHTSAWQWGDGLRESYFLQD